MADISLDYHPGAHNRGSAHGHDAGLRQRPLADWAIVELQNPSVCLNPPFGIGGFWGWIEFDRDNTGDATLTGCSHLSTSLGVLTGADHLQVEITNCPIAPGSAGPATFLITDGTVSLTGVNTRGAPVTVPWSALGMNDTGVPAVADHYSFPSVMGFTPPPGVNFQIQVVQVSQ